MGACISFIGNFSRHTRFRDKSFLCSVQDATPHFSGVVIEFVDLFHFREFGHFFFHHQHPVMASISHKEIRRVGVIVVFTDSKSHRANLVPENDSFHHLLRSKIFAPVDALPGFQGQLLLMTFQQDACLHDVQNLRGFGRQHLNRPCKIGLESGQKLMEVFLALTAVMTLFSARTARLFAGLFAGLFRWYCDRSNSCRSSSSSRNRKAFHEFLSHASNAPITVISCFTATACSRVGFIARNFLLAPTTINKVLLSFTVSGNSLF